MSHQTRLKESIAGYDQYFEKALFNAIVTTVFTTSKVSDAPVIALRTGETIEALLSVLGLVLACSPAVTRSPTTIRQTCDRLTTTLQRRVSSAEHDEEMREFIRAVTHGGGVR